jgi:hypothetical protein
MMSAEDLVTFARALANGGVGPNGARVLSADMAAAMTRPTAEVVAIPGAAWGLGWRISPGGVLTHGGGGPGVASVLYVHGPSRRVAALLTNCDRGLGMAESFLAPIVQSWTGLEPPKPQPPGPPPDSLDPYLGVFGNNAARRIFANRDGSLTLQSAAAWAVLDNQVRPTPPVPLAPTGPDWFETPALGGRPGEALRFVNPAADGRMSGVFSRLRYFERLQ